MLSDKELKKEFRKRTEKDPEKYYAVEVLKKDGFERRRCSCGKYFWTTDDKRKTCGDPTCEGGFSFIGNTPAKHKMEYIEVWDKFSKMFSKFGYKPIPRYPVVARWRDDTDFVQASIYNFQPYVVSGEVEPPAKMLVVPQTSLRFNDIDNVGITGSHFTAFNMIGQHAFMNEKEWNQKLYFEHIYLWLKDGLGLPKKEITFHEDAWAGGGNFGPCMEFFSRGLELGNQVYMQYENTPSGPKELKLKVLDMGMGHERNTWFSNGTPTSYEVVFPTALTHLQSATGLDIDQELMRKFIPYASMLNADETEDLDASWKNVAKHMKVDVLELKKNIVPYSALFSVAEHSRTLLFAFNDGALPSNTGGGYNLRVILRRALSFIEKYRWNVDMGDICEIHANYLEPLFPELKENLDEVKKILNYEKSKYKETTERSKRLVGKMIEKEISKEDLVNLYDSNGINPELIVEEAKKLGKDITIPANFYSLVSERHTNETQKAQTKREEKLDMHGIIATIPVYFEGYDIVESKGVVLKIIGKNVILDKTIFYPTSGGQLHDTGTLNGQKVVEVIKQGNIIVHIMENEPDFKEGDLIKEKIDFDRRLQLAQHHTATHIVNYAARRVLGSHVWQTGAAKYLEKARLDITHFEQLKEEEIQAIERIANEVVSSNLLVYKQILKRNLAEAQYGFRLYQGGVPGKEIRVVSIGDIEHEACGGTHLNLTGDIKQIRILKTSKISDGCVRIEFTAGHAAEKLLSEEEDVAGKLAKLLGVKDSQIPARAQELFDKWKKSGKILSKLKDTSFAEKVKNGAEKIHIHELELHEKKEFEGDPLLETEQIFRTQKNHLIKTAERFLNELKENKEKISKAIN